MLGNSDASPVAFPARISLTARDLCDVLVQRPCVWMPGPDRDFDIIVNNDFRIAFDKLRMRKNWQRRTTVSTWLNERLYDPTNGIRSSGDILRTQLGELDFHENRKNSTNKRK